MIQLSSNAQYVSYVGKQNPHSSYRYQPIRWLNGRVLMIKSTRLVEVCKYRTDWIYPTHYKYGVCLYFYDHACQHQPFRYTNLSNVLVSAHPLLGSYETKENTTVELVLVLRLLPNEVGDRVRMLAY